MTNKQTYYPYENTNDFLSRVYDFCAPIIATLGPGGMNSIIQSYDSEVPHITKDGVTISESMHFKDPITNALASLIKEAARKTSKTAGDGTTTSIVLTRQLLESIAIVKELKNKKLFFDTIKDIVSKVVDYLEDSKLDIKDNFDVIKNIINISGNGDKEITKIVLEAFTAVGDFGIVNVDTKKEDISRLELINGIQLDTTYFCAAKGDYKNVIVAVVEGPLTKTFYLDNALRLSKSNGTESLLIIIAKEFSNEVKHVVQVNNDKGITNIALVIAEGYGANRLEVLKDIAFIGKGKLLSTEGVSEIAFADCDMLNVCINFDTAILKDREIVLTVTDPSVYDDSKSLLKSLSTQYTESLLNESTAETTKIKLRLTKYAKIANIIVGGITVGEQMERKDRFDDAVCAVKSALKNGVLIGGGISLWKAAEDI